MRLGIIARSDPNWGGVYRYTLTLISAFMKMGDNHKVVVYTKTGNISDYMKLVGTEVELQVLPDYIRTIPEDIIEGDLNNFRITPGRNRYAYDFFEHQNIDILMYPSPTNLAFQCGYPYAMAIHDLQHRLQPWFPEVSCKGEWLRREYCYTNSIRNAKAIIVDSEQGRDDLLVYYHNLIPKNRIFIAPYVSSFKLDFSDTESAIKKSLPNKFIFYPAQFWLHKNHARIIHAIQIIKLKYGIHIPIVFVGSNSGNHREGREIVFSNVIRLAKQLDVSELVHYYGYVDDKEMPTLYKSATALVMPTFFGPTNIPIIEAWSFECPVITSDIPGVREQVGEAGVLVRPDCIEDLTSSIYRIWVDEGLRNRLKKEGSLRINKISQSDYQHLFQLLSSNPSTQS